MNTRRATMDSTSLAPLAPELSLGQFRTVTRQVGRSKNGTNRNVQKQSKVNAKTRLNAKLNASPKPTAKSKLSAKVNANSKSTAKANRRERARRGARHSSNDQSTLQPRGHSLRRPLPRPRSSRLGRDQKSPALRRAKRPQASSRNSARPMGSLLFRPLSTCPRNRSKGPPNPIYPRQLQPLPLK
ncbi:MAG: hypothetical protein ACI87A_002818 [Planctomycetota bacterium]|jgi:hypothetical protein